MMLTSKSIRVSDTDAVTIRTVEKVLLTHPLINDCAVLIRETDSSKRELIAYVVSTESVSIEQLQSDLQDRLPPANQPSLYIPVATLPLTELGQVDEQALLRLPAIDAELVQQWQDTLQSITAIEQVAVVSQPFSEPSSALHLSDLLLDWQPTVSPSVSALPSVSATVLPSESLAIAQVEGSDPPEEKFATLAEMLRQTALETADKGILYLQSDGSEVFQSYPALLEAAERILTGLRQLGLQPQDKVIFQLDRNSDFIPTFWGCLLGGFVPVPLSVAPTYESANSAVSKLHQTWELLKQPMILASQDLERPIRSAFADLGANDCRVQAIDTLRSNEPDHNWYTGQPDDLALLIFTSGSTGRPKGVMLSHRNILSNVSSSAQFNEVSRTDISLNWLHLDHVGSLIRCCIRDIYVGCQQIHAPAEQMLEDPLRWLDWIEKYRVSYAWAPNFALGLINAQADVVRQRQWDLSCLKSLLSVAEAIVPQTARRFLELLAPFGLTAHAMHSAWGMSETGAAVVFSHRYLLEASSNPAFVEVGTPVSGFSIRIVDDHGQIVDEGTTGLLQIKGAMITRGYYESPELTQAAFTEDGWFKTGDLGVIRNDRLTVTGRQKDIIIINGLNHYSHEIEAVVEEIAGIESSYTAAFSVRTTESNTDQLAILFHPIDRTDLAELVKEIRGAIARKIQITPTYLIPVAKESIPKTSLGKIQRSLLKQRFEAGEFNPILRQIDCLTGNANTVPDWFYKRVWQRREAVARSPQTHSGQSIVFLDRLGLGQRLCPHLSQPCIQVEAGTEFVQLSSDYYQIDPKNPYHYRQLLQAVAASGAIVQILHLWTYGDSDTDINLEALQQAQEFGVYSVLFLIQALHNVQLHDVQSRSVQSRNVQGSEPLVQLFVISSHAQATSPDADIIHEKTAYEKTPVLGLVKTIPQELPQIDCRHIDLTAADIQIDLACLLQEIQVLQKQQEVAYRHGQRLVPYLQKVDLPQAQTQELPFKSGGLYLLSGGLGEIAVEVAHYLLKYYNARLLLVGRSPLPNAPGADSLEPKARMDRRIQAYRSLQQLGDVLYEAVDICDLASLQQSVDRVKQRWQCELEGVIHLAGIGKDCLLTEETPESFAATLQPKVFGTWVLHQLLQQQPGAVFISISSVLSLQGALSVGAYAAANRFLDGFWHYQQRCHPQLRSYCFGSSTWAGVGISRGYESRSARYAQGREVMSAVQGLHSLLACLHYGSAHLLAGLDGNHPQIRQQRLDTSAQAHQLSAYFTASGDRILPSSLQATLKNSNLCDRFQVQTSCNFLPIPEMPLTATGAIDFDRLKRATPATLYMEPRTDLERRLVLIWQTVLGVPKVGIQDNFFDLGGSSLLALRLFAQIEQEFGDRLPLAVLFQAVTVEQQADLLRQEKPDTLWSSLVAIQPNGSKPPLFAVHGLYGDILFYRDLVQRLGNDQPFYGLQAQGLNQQQPCLTQIEDMAAHYLQEIQTIQSEGPYFLAGYSLGGLIAFEMAQQLHQQGQKVALLALLDTWNLCRYEHLCYFKKLPRHRRMLLHLKNLYRLDLLEQLTYAVEKVRARIRERRETKQFSSPESLVEATLVATNKMATETYAPQVYPGKVSLFAIEEQDLEFYAYFDPQLGWGKLAAGGVELYQVPGEHLTMITEPHVQTLAEHLKACIEKAIHEP
jgi:acyl-CoA synthetase (AMP-forming)/AMP-acid ligase II/thioesterase domain-containing protein/acyl carrier protein